MGMDEREHFMKAVVRYRDRWVEYAEDKHDAGVEEFPDYPRFVYEGIPPGDRLRKIFIDVLVLGIWNIGFFMAAYLSFLRYDLTS